MFMCILSSTLLSPDHTKWNYMVRISPLEFERTRIRADCFAQNYYSRQLMIYGELPLLVIFSVYHHDHVASEVGQIKVLCDGVASSLARSSKGDHVLVDILCMYMVPYDLISCIR